MKMKVLHVLNSGNYSGAENVVLSIIKNTNEYIEGIYLTLEGPMVNVLDENGVKYYILDKLTRKKLNEIVKEVKPDIIHAHDFRASVLAASLLNRIPTISHLHNNSPWLKEIDVYSIIYALSTFRYKKILTVSDSVMDEFIFSALCKKKSEVIGNPVDIHKITDSVSDKNVCEPYEIAFLGRLSFPKNPIFFIEIIEELKRSIPDVRVKIIGDGELRHQVELKINELALQESIELLGFQSNPYGYLYQAKILCMPSLWEGFGLAAVEALALGKPVIASPVGGLVNIINDRCGFLAQNKEEYVEELRKLLLDSSYYREKSTNAIDQAYSLDNIESYMNKIISIYRLLTR